jgi:hypothetical protein
MVAKLTGLTHKIAIKLHIVAESCVLAPDGQSGNFWIHPHTCVRTGFGINERNKQTRRMEKAQMRFIRVAAGYRVMDHKCYDMTEKNRNNTFQ